MIRCRQNKGDLALDPVLHTQFSSRSNPGTLGATIAPKRRNASKGGLYLICSDQPGALELPGGILMARTPQKILVIEPRPDIIPAGIAGMIVDHPIGRFEFVRRMGEA